MLLIIINVIDKIKFEVLVIDVLGYLVLGVEVKWVSDLKLLGFEYVISIINEYGIVENNFSLIVIGIVNIIVQVGIEVLV